MRFCTCGPTKIVFSLSFPRRGRHPGETGGQQEEEKNHPKITGCSYKSKSELCLKPFWEVIIYFALCLQISLRGFPRGIYKISPCLSINLSISLSICCAICVIFGDFDEETATANGYLLSLQHYLVYPPTPGFASELRGPKHAHVDTFYFFAIIYLH